MQHFSIIHHSGEISAPTLTWVGWSCCSQRERDSIIQIIWSSRHSTNWTNYTVWPVYINGQCGIKKCLNWSLPSCYATTKTCCWTVTIQSCCSCCCWWNQHYRQNHQLRLVLKQSWEAHSILIQQCVRAVPIWFNLQRTCECHSKDSRKEQDDGGSWEYTADQNWPKSVSDGLIWLPPQCPRTILYWAVSLNCKGTTEDHLQMNRWISI